MSMSAADGPAGPGQALANIQKAFDTFQQTVKKDDARSFSSTELRDVWAAAKDVEAKLVAKQQARNLKKIQPFLNGLEHYSKAIEVLCNGTPYLPWIWAPIKLCLIIASDSIEALEKLIRAYGEIAEALPRFGMLADTLNGNLDFQNVLALFYCDILNFHQRAYRLFTQNAWQRFFNTTWKRFDLHFGTVLESLKRHRDLIDSEASAYNLVTTAGIAAECHRIRQQAEEQAALREKQRTESILPAVLTWIGASSLAFEDDFQRLSDVCHPGTCSWFLRHKTVVQWLKNGSSGTKLWVTGKPGSGKSVLSVQLVQHLKTQQDTTVVFHACNFRTASQNDRGAVLRNLVMQLIVQHPDLSAFAFEEYMQNLKFREASVTCLKELAAALLSGLNETRIVIDALDECQPKEQQAILKDVLSLVNESCKSSNCKLVLFSRDVNSIARSLKKQPRVNLAEESEAISFAISVLVKHEVSKFTNEQDHLSLVSQDIELLESDIVEKADGMFLWVRLVLDTLEDVHSMYELRLLVHKLPKGLDEAYSRCLDHIAGSFDDDKRAQIIRIFHWIAFAQQPLTIQELLNGVAYSAQPYALDDATALTRAILDLAKPLVEVTPTGIVGFVHFTVKEFLLHKDSQLNGPFLQPSLAQRDIVLASCLSLWDCLDLVDPMIGLEQVVLRTVKGYCALQAYTAKYWISHLKHYAAAVSSTGTEADEQLVRAIERLIHRHASLAINRRKPSPPLLLKLPHTRTLTPLCDPSHSYLVIEWSSINSKAAEVLDRVPENLVPRLDDKTSTAALCLLYEATESLQTITQNLLNFELPANYPRIEREHLEDFRAMNSARAFICRDVRCPRRSHGFPDETTRDLHEKTHAVRFLCLETSCAFNSSIGFASAKELAAHRKKFHEDLGPRIPRFRTKDSHGRGLPQTHDEVQRKIAASGPVTRPSQTGGQHEGPYSGERRQQTMPLAAQNISNAQSDQTNTIDAMKTGNGRLLELESSGQFTDPSFTTGYSQQAQSFGSAYPDFQQQQQQQGNSNHFFQSQANAESFLFQSQADAESFPTFDINQNNFDQSNGFDPSLLSDINQNNFDQSNGFDPSLLSDINPATLDLLPADTDLDNNHTLDPMAAMALSHSRSPSPTPPHLVADRRRISGSPSPHASPRFA